MRRRLRYRGRSSRSSYSLASSRRGLDAGARTHTRMTLVMQNRRLQG
ncbi:hypothetical protein AZ78_3907 [Lysobacter capsici AZ78]|uniref:Uncharacterized protein n=1 Tax=Lysobacter capsici AZ78 TaxID=1444315 RepID=A0A125MNE9_9GAMM|nr:hypothetical protein AZ78_3907 [Lysobacter capsici AZ78]